MSPRALLVLLALSLPLAAQAKGESPKPAEGAKAESPKPEEDKPSITRHEMRLGGKSLKYTATAGYMPLKSEKGELEAKLFYTAYTLDGAGPDRPLVFAFNGGPGSGSLWLHLGALGPKRVKLLDDGQLPPPPFQLVDNESTWLDQADLVFIDPVGTGYSRADKPELNKRFWSVKGDVESVGEFIRLYLTRNERWRSPLFLAGESYGTTRASALSDHLLRKGIALNGIVLVSSIMNFQTAEFADGNDLPPQLFLPTYAATAWYHHKLPADLQAKDLKSVLAEAEAYAMGDYAKALAAGDQLSAADRDAVAAKVARFTGLSKTYVLQANLRPVIFAFDQELLRDRNRLVGRLESRFQGIPSRGTAEHAEFDPLLAAVMPPYTAAMNDYARRELGFKTDLEYQALNFEVNRAWEWGEGNSMLNTSTALASALRRNPYMKVMIANGYYDLGTPYLATRYTVDHMALEPAQRANITLTFYEAGHMMYIDSKCLKQLKQDAAALIQSALKN
ncbi:MAG TPA: hypothetical protein VJ600_00295 [Holophagaceae bacterium]|nr:hypothetical protein [Holophagaceae bacterium]